MSSRWSSSSWVSGGTLALLRRRLRRVLEVGAQLAARHLDHVAVPHAGRDLRFHRQLLASKVDAPAAGPAALGANRISRRRAANARRRLTRLVHAATLEGTKGPRTHDPTHSHPLRRAAHGGLSGRGRCRAGPRRLPQRADARRRHGHPRAHRPRGREPVLHLSHRLQGPRRPPRRLLVAVGPVDRRARDPRRRPRPLPLPRQRRPPPLPSGGLPRRRRSSSSRAACPRASCSPTTIAAKRASTSSASTSRTTRPRTTASIPSPSR